VSGGAGGVGELSRNVAGAVVAAVRVMRNIGFLPEKLRGDLTWMEKVVPEPADPPRRLTFASCRCRRPVLVSGAVTIAIF
jgi:hypothetical protein